MTYAADPIFRLPLGSWVAAFITWFIDAFRPVLNLIKTALLGVYDALFFVLDAPPVWVTILVLALIALLASGWRLAVATIAGLLVIYGVSQWELALATLALVLVAAVIALAVAIPVGIAAAKSQTVSNIVRPVLDFMQTMPAFVYLIPVVMIFYAGPVPGIVATIVFAMPPGVRLTELGIRQVDREVVEAGHAFGSSPWRILRQIELPLALPTIMAGINQVIMLALSMVVIGGMVGAGGLGKDIVNALSRVNVSLGFEAGVAVVIVAIYLDRVTAALSSRSPVAQAMKVQAAGG